MIAPSDFDNTRPPSLPAPSSEQFLEFLKVQGFEVIELGPIHISPGGSHLCNHGTDHAPDAQGTPYGTYPNSDLKPFIDGKEGDS